jgi:hypothetical protein
MWQMKRGIASVMQIFAFYKYDTSRITIVKGGFREYNTVDSWIVPPGAEPPKPTPTVDEKFVTIPQKSTSKNRRR